MSSIAWRFVGSAIATMSDEPARETGMILCFSQTSRETSFRTSASISYSSRLIAGTRYCVREEVRDLAVGDVPELGERVAEVLPGLLLLVLRLPELLQADELLPDEELTESALIDIARTVVSLGRASECEPNRRRLSTVFGAAIRRTTARRGFGSLVGPCLR